MIELPFTKMHGLGNCFILMDDRATQASPLQAIADRDSGGLEALAKAVCDRNFGIGADGLILVQNSDVGAHDGDKAQHAAPLLRMRIINEDGSEAEMCGNGIRCMAKFVNDMTVGAQPAAPSILRIETLAGIMQTRLLDDGRVEVDMGEPTLINDDVVNEGKSPVTINEEGFEFTYVSMGNPHAIAFVDDLDFDWRAKGAVMEKSPSFPNRTNVEFVKIVNPREAIMKVWERGCGETMACGTGACAVVVAGALRGLLPREPVTVELPGGPLTIHWNDRNRVLMTGPAVTVCKGIYCY